MTEATTTPERGLDIDEPTLTFIGNATVLLRYCGVTVLTDPNFLHRGRRAYLGYGLTARRRTEPGAVVGRAARARCGGALAPPW